jgi:putative flippase GtrA
MRIPIDWRFVRFLFVGVLNTAFGYGLFALLVLVHIPYAAASFLSTAAGILFNFKSYGTLVFGSKDNRLLWRFIGVYALCYGLNLIPLAWADRNGVSVLVVAAIMALPMAFLSYVLNRRFVFHAR